MKKVIIIILILVCGYLIYNNFVKNSNGIKNNKVNGTNSTIEKGSLSDVVEIGDIIMMTPTSTSYTIKSDLTGCAKKNCFFEEAHGNDYQIIKPNQMKWWIVIDKRKDGTIDVVSEYSQEDINENGIYFYGKEGYRKIVYSLNLIAKQYENNKYTVGSRHFGYNGQTEIVTTALDSNAAGKKSTPKVGGNSNGKEYKKGLRGDTLYAKDVSLLIKAKRKNNPNISEKEALDVKKLDKNGNVNPGLTGYWLASRYYHGTEYLGYGWELRKIFSGKMATANGVYTEDRTEWERVADIRPVLTLKANLKAVKSNEPTAKWILE